MRFEKVQTSSLQEVRAPEDQFLWSTNLRLICFFQLFVILIRAIGELCVKLMFKRLLLYMNLELGNQAKSLKIVYDRLQLKGDEEKLATLLTICKLTALRMYLFWFRDQKKRHKLAVEDAEDCQKINWSFP